MSTAETPAFAKPTVSPRFSEALTCEFTLDVKRACKRKFRHACDQSFYSGLTEVDIAFLFQEQSDVHPSEDCSHLCDEVFVTSSCNVGEFSFKTSSESCVRYLRFVLTGLDIPI